jgi:hypothetical protein
MFGGSGDSDGACRACQLITGHPITGHLITGASSLFVEDPGPGPGFRVLTGVGAVAEVWEGE